MTHASVPALLTRLREALLHPPDPLLPLKVADVFCYPPWETEYPYGLLQGEGQVSCFPRTLLSFRLILWSTVQGMEQVETLATQVQELLCPPLAVMGGWLAVREVSQALTTDGQGVRCLALGYKGLYRAQSGWQEKAGT
jgi:hypothetical protein